MSKTSELLDDLTALKETLTEGPEHQPEINLEVEPETHSTSDKPPVN